MLRYTVNQVENLTGIKAHTLRIWEKRYNIIRAHRTESNIRYYNDTQLKKLLNISILLQNGFRISQLDKMAIEEINLKVTELLSSRSVEFQDQIQALVLSMLDLDEMAFNDVYQKSVENHGIKNSFLKLIYPFMGLVGGLWTTNQAIPAQEHFISNLIRQKLISAIESLETPKNPGKSIILSLLEGERHELALLFANFLAKQAGWGVYYLGQNVPDGDIIRTAEYMKPHAILTIITTNQANKTLKSLKSIREQVQAHIYITGNIDRIIDKTAILDIKALKTPQEFEEILNLD